MQEALYTFLELNKRSVWNKVNDCTLNLGPHSVFRIYSLPRIGRLLLKPQRNPHVVLIEIQHHDLNGIAYGHDLARVRDTPPAHVCYVQEAYDACTKINESTEVRYVPYDTAKQSTLL